MLKRHVGPLRADLPEVGLTINNKALPVTACVTRKRAASEESMQCSVASGSSERAQVSLGGWQKAEVWLGIHRGLERGGHRTLLFGEEPLGRETIRKEGDRPGR
jgi:hypothetical protein